MNQYGILAFPAKHSLSPAMFNEAFKAIGLDAEYEVFEIPREGLAGFMERVKSEPIEGLSVSLPHKESVLDDLDEVDEDARRIGAVNTIVNKGGILHGYNTDFIGSNRALEEIAGKLRGKRVVVVGAGGASRAVLYGLLKEEAFVSIYNRSEEKAHKLALEFGEMFGAKIESGDLAAMQRSSGEVLVQTSSIWTLNPDMSLKDIGDLFPISFVGSFDVVMDIVYKPLITPLLAVAQGLGKTIVTGEKMLLYQAIEQFKIWTGKDAPETVMKSSLEKLLT